MVLFNKRLSEDELVTRRLPIHAQNVFARTDKLLWVAMALQAPFHIERVGLPHQWHLIDLPMARDTPDPFLYVDAMVEIDKIGQIMHTNPLEGSVSTEALPHWF